MSSSETPTALPVAEALTFPPATTPADLTQAVSAAPKRLQGMAAGAATLLTWLEDLLSEGLGSAAAQSPKHWQDAAVRLVDAQLPNLASRLRMLAATQGAPQLAGLGELYNLTQALLRLDQLGPEARAEVLQLVGVTVPTDKLFDALPVLTDDWDVLGQEHVTQDQLTAHRTWLRGYRTGRLALVLTYTNSPHATQCDGLPGQGTYRDRLTYYPGLLPLRAAFKPYSEHVSEVPAPAPPAQFIAEGLALYAQALGRNPWLRAWPLTLTAVVPAHLPDGRWALYSPAEGVALPLRLTPDGTYRSSPSLDAFCQAIALRNDGQPTRVFGEWDGTAFHPLAAWPEPDATPLPATAAARPAARLPTFDAPVAAPAWGEPWPALLAAATRGTRHGAAALPALPGPPTDGTPAQLLLRAAGTVAVLARAGYQPPTNARPLAPFPAAEWPALDDDGTDLVRQLLAYQDEPLLGRYLAGLLAARRTLPPALVPALLATSWTRQLLDYPYHVLLGPFGHWLGTQRPAWQVKEQPPAPDAMPAERGSWHGLWHRDVDDYVVHLRTTDPDGSRDWLTARLAELGDHDQGEVLAHWATNLSAADEPLLTTLLGTGDTYAFRAAVRLLVRLPGSALLERLWARAVPLLAVEQLPDQPLRLAVQLPGKWDKSWLLDGVASSGERLLAYRAPALLSQLLGLLPPSRWAAHLGLSPEQLVSAARAVPKHDERILLAWNEACVLHHDLPVATAMLHAYLAGRIPAIGRFQHQQPYLVDRPFTSDERLTLLLAPDAHPRLLPLLLPGVAMPWPPALASQVLRLLPHPELTANDQELRALLTLLPGRLPDDYLAAGLAAIEQAYPHRTPNSPWSRARQGLRLRQQMPASLTEPGPAAD